MTICCFSTYVTHIFRTMSCVSFAGVKTFGRLEKFANASQPLTASRFVSQARFGSPKLPEGEDAREESISRKLTAKWKWVIRGKYKVAAFVAENNPAVAVESSESKYLHRHTCSNCKMIYDHSHPYQSLRHPQHIKDCPHCKAFAPPDEEINKLSS